MYKDKDKQREANRKASRRARIKHRHKADLTPLAQGMTNEGMTPESEQGMTGSCCIDHAHNFTGEIIQPKRGKDIKCFADLPPDVQQTIDKMSVFNGKIDRAIKINRTAITINYQHLFPDRYYPEDAVISSPVCVGKPGDADYNGVCTPEWRAKRGR